MKTLKIIKISEGVFKHILVEESGIEHAFFNTKETKLSIDLGTVSISSAGQNRNFTVGNIEVFGINMVNPTPTDTLDDLVSVLATLQYPPLLDTQSSDSATGGTNVDKELVVTTYLVKTAFTGASIGDTITAAQIIDVTAAPTTVSTLWRNQTTGLDLASAPSAANLTLLGSQALTDSQLRASDVPVSTPLPELPITGQGKIATTGTAVQMPNKVLKNGIVIKSSPDNLSPLFIGTSDVTTVNDGTGNGYKLDPGEAISFAIKNTNTIYVNGTAGSVYYYSGN